MKYPTILFLIRGGSCSTSLLRGDPRFDSQIEVDGSQSFPLEGVPAVLNIKAYPEYLYVRPLWAQGTQQNTP